MEFAELLASRFAVEARELITSSIIDPPKPLRPASAKVMRLTDATLEVSALIAQGTTANDAMKAVLKRYPDITESKLDNAAINGTRTDVNAELKRRGLRRETQKRKLNLAKRA